MCFNLRFSLIWIIVGIFLGVTNSKILGYRHMWNNENSENLCPKLTLKFFVSNSNSTNLTNSTKIVNCDEAKEGERCLLQCYSSGGLICAKVWDRTQGIYLAMWVGSLSSCNDMNFDNFKIHKAALMKDDFKVYKLAQQSQKTCDGLQIDSTQGVTGNCPSGQIGAVCFFTCRANFYPTTGNGQFRLTCTDDPNEPLGYWRGAIPNCKRVMCPNINAPSGGVLSGACVDAPVDSVCNLQCTGNTRPVGVTSVRCVADPGSRVGRWNSPLGICQSINCPNLPFPTDGSSSGQCSAASPGSICNFMCRPGFTLIGSNQLQCLDTGQWNTNVPTCRVNTCPNLGTPENGATSGTCSNAVPGNKCNFQCNPGFQLNGISDLTCQNDGLWTGPAPFCSQIFCDDLIAPYQGSTNGNCVKATPGQLCSFYCNSGYRLIGSPVLTCNVSAQWSTTSPICERIICSSLSPPLGGRLSGKCVDASPQDVCNFSCLPGYKPSEIQSIICQSDGTWSEQLPPCQELLCPNVFPPEGGAMNGKCINGTYGAVCNFTCNPGYRLLGADSITCQSSGFWTGNPPMCQRITCPSLYAPSQGTTIGDCVNSGPGSTCEFKCLPGNILAGDSILTCNPDGTWNYQTPTCNQITCPVIEPPLDGNASDSCRNANPNQYCYFTCGPSFKLLGANSSLCQINGVWTNPTPICQKIICPDLNGLQNGFVNGNCTKAEVNQLCNFGCNQGFKLQGQNVLKCQNTGTWTTEPPVCQPNLCPDLLAPIDGGTSGSCSQSPIGSQCTFFCNTGYVLSGQSPLTCTGPDGVWDGNAPTCSRVRCPNLTPPPGGSNSGSCTNASPTNLCAFYCSTGFRLVGNNVTTCQDDGTWTNPVPECQRVVCSPDLVAPQGGTTSGTCTSATTGDQCNFACGVGYRILGVNRLTCQNDGQWTGIPPVCEAIMCSDLVAPFEGVITGKCVTATPGVVCNFNCNKGFTLNGNPQLVCMNSGSWNAPTPTCSRVICPTLGPPPGGSSSGRCSNASPPDVCQFYCPVGQTLIGSPISTCLDNGTWSSPTPACQRNMCPPLPAPENGVSTGTCANAFYNDGCQFNCSAGYRLTGSSWISCLSNGSWALPIATCERILCQSLSTPPNAQASGVCTNAGVGAQCTFTCNQGYIPTNPMTLTCTESGSWNGQQPICQRILCPNLMQPENGMFSGTCNSATPGQQCQFSCMEGYRLLGSPVSNCQDNGAWSNPTPTCQRIICPEILAPVNGNQAGQCSNASPGGLCQFTCQNGYVLIGNPSSTCQNDGTYSTPTPTCQQIMCPTLAPPVNGNSSGTCTNATPGQDCQFSCQPGYRLFGSPVSNCQPSGTWTSPTPSCQKITCPDLPPPANGNEAGICAGASPGDVCQFSCLQGYNINGNPSATCQPDGNWSNQPPACQQILCPNLNSPSNGNSAGTCSNAIPGQVCQFTCQQGYNLIGSPVSNCQPTGTWSSPTPTCQKITCPNLPPPINGNESGICSNGSPGDICQFSCNSGYILTGNPSVNCQQDGTWSNQPPTCQQIVCPNLGPPTNGNNAGTCSNAIPGQVCQFTCQQGYLLIGNQLSNCQPTGTWSSPTPTCQRIICANLTPPQNGNQSGVCSNALPGDICQFSCNQGYILNGNPSANCQQDGSWSNQPPSCQQLLCPNIQAPQNGLNSGSCQNAPIGSQCSFSCNNGYQMVGNPQISCQNDGTWSTAPPICQQISCPEITIPANSQTSGVCTRAVSGSQCSFTCNGGYSINGAQQITCQTNGQWSASPPVCVQIVCPSLVPPISGTQSGTCQNAAPDSQCSFSCNPGFRLMGATPLTCQIDGNWNANTPTCAEINCPNLQPNSDSRITGKCQQAVPTDTCTFSCNQGFQPMGNTNFVCQADGTWTPNGNPPTCNLITCPTLNNIENGMSTGVCASAPANSACRFQCNAGYQLIGSSTLLCNDAGTWSGPPPTCEGVSCPDLIPPKDGVSSGICQKASSGNSCSFACNPGFYLQGQSALTCTDRGNWNNPTPICLPISCPDLQTPLNGIVNGICKNAKAYDQCAFACAQGYNLEGVSTLTCQIDSKWTGLAPRCIRVTCPDLNVPQYGTTSGSCVQAAQGSVCNFVCNNGYILQGVPSLTCQPTGQWNGNSPSCRLLQCPDLRAPVEGRVQGICTQASPGAVCSFSCNPCYRLRGDATLTCSNDGLWSGNAPLCEVITCQDLTPPQSASFSGVCQKASPGNICKITCSSTTRIRGPNSITCQANGTWSDQLPTCGAITCPNLVVPSGGLQSGSCVQASPGSICSFTCNAGNTIMGPSSLSCGPDGTWSGQPPTCTTVVCPDVSPPTNGQLSQPCRGSVSGRQCQFTCNPGFQINGAPVITCRPDGSWDANPPVCAALNCPVLSSRPGGTASGICTLAISGNRCNFICDAGYQLVGDSSLTCLPTGQWDKQVPECVGTKCPDLFAPTGGTTSGSCSGAVSGGICNFQCNGELVLSGSPSLTCQPTGNWNSDPPICSATPRCQDLLPPAGGSISGQCSSAMANAICTYVCLEGREIRGFNQLTCRSDGTWSSDPPTCDAPQCPALPIPQNGIASGSCSGASSGQSCQFNCNPGFMLTGAAILTCQSPGRWDNAAPTCQQPGVNCQTVNINNAVASGACTNAGPGRVCEIACNVGFRINGPSKLICLSTGNWDNTFPNCAAVTCPAIAAPENGAASGACATATFNQRCDFKCNAGFSLEGSASITCLSDGNWNESPPSCPQTTCAELANPQYGAISGTCAGAVGGDKCEFSCENGFRLSTSTASTLTCRPDGNWDTSPPTCIRIVCPRKTGIANGRATGICQDAAVEQICSFECNSGYKLQGSKDLTCTANAQWNAESPTCIVIKCQALSTPVNGRMSGSCAESFPGDQCNFGCSNEYNLIGSAQLTCQPDGTWNGQAPTCEVQVKCPNLQDPVGGNTRGACSRADPGKTCLFTCDAGYNIDGEETLTCQASGQWTSPPPKCQQIRCPALNRPDNGQTSGTCSNRAIYGDECRFSCSRGYRLNGRSTSRCTLTGEWTEPVPTCEPNTCGPLSVPQTGTGTEGCANGIYNDRCTITCNEGYRLIGAATSTCTAEGSWSSGPPTCELQTCRSLTVPTNGRMSGRCSPGNAFQDCSFECNVGYRLIGTASITCEANGRWNGAEPTCQQIQCPALQAVPNSAASGQCSPGLPGAACRFVCRRGFKIQGPASVSCSVDGAWETQPPTCDPLKCSDLTPPPQGTMTGSCTGATLDGKCTFKCNAGYSIEGGSRNVLTCQADEQWDELIPTCVMNNCPDLAAPDDGAMTGDCSPGMPTKTCTFTCNQNYKLVGRAVLTCKNNGAWNYPAPVCSQILCPRLRAPGNGSMDGVCEPNGIAPDTCTFTCASGFNLVGTESLTCQENGRWNERPPKCVAITCPNKFPPNGASIAGQCSRATPGQTCKFTCINLNTRLIGNDILICNDDGTWSSESPVCEAILCPDIEPIENLQMRGVCKNARPNDVCRFNCAPGSNLAGTSSITCNRDGTWSGSPPQCTAVICPPLSPPANGAMEGDCAPGVPSQTCTVTCNEGLSPASSIYTCQPNGNWNPVPPNPLSCNAGPEPITQAPNPNPICSRLIRPPNGRIDRCDLYAGGRCIFTCNNGYVIYGGPVRTCQPNGRWDGLAPTCIKRTVVIPNGAYQQRRTN